MVSKYKKIYQTSVDELTQTCRQWIGFTYKGDGIFTIEYILCGETEPRQFIINLPGNGGNDAYYNLTIEFEGIPCVIEGSVIKISPEANLFTPEYGNSCPIASLETREIIT